MIKIDPQQEFFTRLKIDLEALGFDVYDGILPSEDTPYPFIYLGDNTQTDKETKKEIIGDVSQTIHVWHSNTKQRGTVSNMLLAVKTACRKIEHTTNFVWVVQSMTTNIFPDKTTKTPLLHGVVNVGLKFS